MGDYHLETHMFFIKMGFCDIVLGAKWLQILSQLIMALQELYMNFKQNGHTHMLRGLQESAPSIIIFHRIEKLLRKSYDVVFSQFNVIQNIESILSTIHLDLQQVLHHHQQVLEKPMKLPHSWGEHDHSIPFDSRKLAAKFSPLQVSIHKKECDWKDYSRGTKSKCYSSQH